VLPGVTVEATSPALIERVRTAVTDGEGLYKIIAPGQMYNDRLNQIDARVTRTFRLGGTRRVQGQFDFYNLLNVGPALNQNNTYGAAWLTPTVIPVGRMVTIPRRTRSVLNERLRVPSCAW
jgi:hypothetical protein